MEEFVRSRGLEQCHSALELPTLGLILDRLVLSTSDAAVVNMSAVEAICRKIYGLLRAFEDVHGLDDWKAPRNHSGKWRSKIKWDLLKEYDVQALESSEWSIADADDEVSERVRRKALFAEHWDGLQESQPPEGGGGK